MHSDLAKLNELVAKNTALQEEVANANYNLETEFVRRYISPNNPNNICKLQAGGAGATGS
jgi:hypothetical protein